MNDFCEIQKLAELFKQFNQDNSEDEDEDELVDNVTVNKNTKFTPSDVGKKISKNEKKKISPYTKIEPKPRENREVSDPFDESEFLDEIIDPQTSKSDWKETPKWDISYRQQVSSSDVFLGMGMKTPSTASCEEMIIKIHLPGEKRQNMDLKILETKITLSSPMFYLDLDLPHPVDPKRGSAQYDKNEQTLNVTLKMDREFDDLNF